MPDEVPSSRFTVVTMYAWTVSIMAVLAGYWSGDWKTSFSNLHSPQNLTSPRRENQCWWFIMTEIILAMMGIDMVNSMLPSESWMGFFLRIVVYLWLCICGCLKSWLRLGSRGSRKQVARRLGQKRDRSGLLALWKFVERRVMGMGQLLWGSESSVNS